MYIGAETSQPTGPFITDPASLTPADAQVGRHVCFADLTVNSITPDGFIEVRSSNERQIYAVFADPNANIKPGDRVDITGTVTRGPGSTNNLDEKGAQTLMAQPYYVQIERIDITTDRAPQVPPPPAPPTEK